VPIDGDDLEAALQALVASGATIHSSFAAKHYRAASYFAGQLKLKEEAALSEGGTYEIARTEAQHLFSACIMSSVACVEAFHNETANRLKLDLEYIDLSGTTNPLDRINNLLRLKKAAPFELGASPAQDLRSMIRLRNAFVHFRPESYTDSKLSEGFEFVLRGKGEASPLFDRVFFFFPDRVCSSSYARWATRSARVFVSEAADRLGKKRPWWVVDPGAK